jgi:DNA (cytosine-5)-methyltransferase 1
MFAGIGGIRLGFEKAGVFETIFVNDFELKCSVTYNINFDSPKMHVQDMREIEVSSIPDFDFFLGGFPCQPFSIAGYRQGFLDEKGKEIYRVILC